MLAYIHIPIRTSGADIDKEMLKVSCHHVMSMQNLGLHTGT